MAGGGTNSWPHTGQRACWGLTVVRIAGPDAMCFTSRNNTPSVVPANMTFPAPLSATALKGADPTYMPKHRPLSRFHTRTVLSSLPDTARRPSAVTLTLLTE